MIDQLKSIGIEKGKPFSPDTQTQQVLEAAAREARAWLDAKYERAFSPSYFEGTHWAVPASPEVIEGAWSLTATPWRVVASPSPLRTLAPNISAPASST
jgi:hypothetical protein